MSTFYNAKVVKIQRETEDAVSVYFEVAPEFKKEFDYKPGQYITIEEEINGETVRRAYSLCTSPFTDSIPAVTVKRVDAGRMSNWVNSSLKEGANIQILAPEGRFIPSIDANAKKHYFLFAGGSGITPNMSILKSVLTQEPNSVVTLIYANRNKKTVIFKDQLEALASQYGSRLEIVHVYDSPGLFSSAPKGPIKPELAAKLFTKHRRAGYTAEAFICGPGGMMDAVKDGLKNCSIPDDAVHVEYFIAPTSKGQTNEVAPESTATTSFTETEVEMKLNGDVHTFYVGTRKTILSGAQDAGLDPPYSCEAGICSTCMAKVTEGSVKMIENNILTKKEIDAGFVLTCQAICTSPKVKVEFFE